jgi:hypothetical protein
MPGSVARMTDPRTADSTSVLRRSPGAPQRSRTAALAQWLADRDGLAFPALACVVAGVAVLLGRIAVSSHHVFIDEFAAISYGRSIADDPSLAFTQSLGRGPERLTSLMAALFAAASDSPSQQIWRLHAAMALCQSLVAVPVWLAGRELGLGRWPAVVAAMIAVGGSFAIYGVSNLNQSVGLLCATVMLWAMLRALRRPGLASDVLVCAGVAATALARLGWAPLVVAIVPGALATAWLERPSGEGPGGWLRALPFRLMRRHPVLVPLFVLGIIVAIVSGPSTLLGGENYGGVALNARLEAATLWDNARRDFSHLAIGVALVPFILAIPVLVRDLAGPADATSGGFAWLVLGLLVAFSYIHYTAVAEDRYLAVLAPPFAIAGVAAVFRRPPRAWAVLVTGVLTARLVTTSYGWPAQGPYDFFIAPTSVFFERVIVDRLPANAPTIALLLALGAALVVTVVARAPRPRSPLGLTAAAIVLAGVLAFQVAAAEYPARRFVDAVGLPEVPSEELSFIDRAAAGGRSEPLAVDAGIHPDLYAQIWFLRVYNRTLGGGMTVMRVPQPPATPALGPSIAYVDWRSGEVDMTGPVPGVVVDNPGTSRVGFSGTPLDGSRYFPFAALQRLRRPLRTLWIVRGDSVQGYPNRGHPLRLRVFPPTARGTCVRGFVAVHPAADRPSRYRIDGALNGLRGVARPGEPVRFTARVPGGPPTTLVLRGGGGRLPDGGRLGPSLFYLSVAECR